MKGQGLLIAAVLCVPLSVASVAPFAAQQATGQAPFRAAVDAVSIDVAVYQGNKPISGLTAADFELTDNGVKQDLTMTSVEKMDIDLTLVFDASGSVQDRIGQLRADARAVSAMLKPTDRLRLITFATLVSGELGLLAGGADPAIDLYEAGGATSFYDALASALIVAQPVIRVDRRQLVVAFSDGGDTTSFLGATDVKAVATRTDAVLHLFIVPGGGGAHPASGWLPYWGGPNVPELTAAAVGTGGQIYQDRVLKTMAPAVKKVLDEFRTSYVLRYTATGVALTGWHDVAVRVTKPGTYIVRAKKRYFAGTEPGR